MKYDIKVNLLSLFAVACLSVAYSIQEYGVFLLGWLAFFLSWIEKTKGDA